MARRRYSNYKLSKYRGGGFFSAVGKVAKRAVSTVTPLLVRKARNSKYRKYVNMADTLLGQPVEKALGDAFSRFSTSSGLVIPKIGVLTSPKIKSSYFKINNMGTGITRSKYTSGTSVPVPKSIYNNAYKQTFVLSDIDSNFTVPNTGTTSSTTRGVAQYGFLEVGDITTLVAQFPASATASSQLGSFYFGGTKSVLTVTSATNLNCSLRVYECVAKRDTNIAQYRTPVDAWSNGLDQTIGGSTTSTYSVLGMYPSSSPFFREYWHVENYFDIDLAAGGTHVHTSTYNVNSTYPNCLYANHGSTSTMNGLTRYYLFVLSGTPVHDSTNENNVQLGGAKVDVNIVQTYEYYSIPFTDEGLHTVVVGDTITTAEVLTDSSFTESGVIN